MKIRLICGVFVCILLLTCVPAYIFATETPSEPTGSGTGASEAPSATATDPSAAPTTAPSEPSVPPTEPPTDSEGYVKQFTVYWWYNGQRYSQVIKCDPTSWEAWFAEFGMTGYDASKVKFYQLQLYGTFVRPYKINFYA